MIRSARDDQPGPRGPRRAVRLLGRPRRRLPQGEARSASTPSRSSRRRRRRRRRPRCGSCSTTTAWSWPPSAPAPAGSSTGCTLTSPTPAVAAQGARLHPLDHRLGRAVRRPGDHRLDAGPPRRRRRSADGARLSRRGPRGPRRTRPAVRRAAAVRAAQPLRDEPGQHRRGRRALLESLSTKNVKLLADLFHMNIEEADVAAAIRAGGGAHRPRPFRRFQPPAGRAAGTSTSPRSPRPCARSATTAIVSAEALPYPDPDRGRRRRRSQALSASIFAAK